MGKICGGLGGCKSLCTRYTSSFPNTRETAAAKMRSLHAAEQIALRRPLQFPQACAAEAYDACSDPSGD